MRTNAVNVSKSSELGGLSAGSASVFMSGVANEMATLDAKSTSRNRRSVFGVHKQRTLTKLPAGTTSTNKVGRYRKFQSIRQETVQLFL